MQLKDKFIEIDARVLNALPYCLVVRLDFLCSFQIVFDFHNRSWFFHSNPEIIYDFEYDNENEDNCLGIRELTKKLADFLKLELPPFTENLGLTNLTEHVIDTGDTPAIKQRNRRDY